MGNPDTDERWQVYDEQGRPVTGKGVSKAEAYAGILHGASHVWVWRRAADDALEVLLQLRAPGKHTWPERLDTSAAGHANNGETPLTAAIRETQEEIGLVVTATDMHFAGMHRCYITANDGFIENEVRFVYTVEMPEGAALSTPDGEVSELIWKPLDTLMQETAHDTAQLYVPHGIAYFGLVAEAVALHAAKA